MRYVIYGAGGIGGVIGARLFQEGQDVVLVARGPHLRAIQERGLVLERPDEKARCPSARSVTHRSSSSATTTSWSWR